MSTHVLDASGSRALSMTVNDPARTGASVSAKAGDDVIVTLGNFDYVEIPIPTTPGACEIIVRERKYRKIKRNEQGTEVRDADRNLVYEDAVETTRLLRLRAFTHAIGRTGTDPEKSVVSAPHTTLRAVDFDKDPHQPVFIQGETVSEEKIDLGYGTEKEADV